MWARHILGSRRSSCDSILYVRGTRVPSAFFRRRRRRATYPVVAYGTASPQQAIRLKLPQRPQLNTASLGNAPTSAWLIWRWLASLWCTKFRLFEQFRHSTCRVYMTMGFAPSLQLRTTVQCIATISLNADLWPSAIRPTRGWELG